MGSGTVQATVHNNGPLATVAADATLDLSVPSDCTRTPDSSQSSDDVSLPQSTATSVSKTWSVTCTDPSAHSFDGSASVAVDQLHVSDLNSGNNSGQDSDITVITSPPTPTPTPTPTPSVLPEATGPTPLPTATLSAMPDLGTIPSTPPSRGWCLGPAALAFLLALGLLSLYVLLRAGQERIE